MIIFILECIKGGKENYFEIYFLEMIKSFVELLGYYSFSSNYSLNHLKQSDNPQKNFYFSDLEIPF